MDFETFNVCLSERFNLPWQVAAILIETEENEKGSIVNRKRAVQDLYLKWDTDLKISKDAKRITKYSKNAFPKRRGLRKFLI